MRGRTWIMVRMTLLVAAGLSGVAGEAAAKPASFDAWLSGKGPAALPPTLVTVRELFTAEKAPLEGGFYHDPEGLKLDWSFAGRTSPAGAKKALGALRAWAGERRVELVGGSDAVRIRTLTEPLGPPEERIEARVVPLSGSDRVEIRVRYTQLRPPAPDGTTLEGVLAHWPGLGDATALPAFLRALTRPLEAVGCDGIPAACDYWTFALPGGDEAGARARAIVTESARHGFVYDAPTGDLAATPATGFQDCSGAVLTTRLWDGRVAVTLQMSSPKAGQTKGTPSGQKSVAACSEAAAPK